jgi:serine/threonine protein kinase/Tol biopolymer transport system component
MNPERWQQIDEVFQAAVELEPAQRAAFLDKACTSDQLLRSKVETMLAADDRGWDLVEQPALEIAAPLLSDDQPQLTGGEHVGHYEIISLIGRGGMGEVYLAKDAKLNRRIALKLLPLDYTKDKDRLRRFQQEAQAASALNHPNILTIHELGEVNGQQFIATEFVEGETLRQRMKYGGLSVGEALDITVQTANALAAAHQAGIVHRDIKPENIMLRPDGYVKVLDFGLAKLIETRHGDAEIRGLGNEDHGFVAGSPRLTIPVSANTLPKMIMGTLKYMSPEQARGLPVDSRSDIFSLGVVLYEMLAGYTPFKGETTSELIGAILEAQPLPPSNAPAGLQNVVLKALCKNREERYQNVEELLIELRNLKEDSHFEWMHSRSALPGASQETIAKSPVPTSKLEAIATITSVKYLVSEFKQHQAGASLALALLAIAAIGMSFGIYKVAKVRRAITPFETIAVAKFTNFSDAWRPTISPDGKYVVYAKGLGDARAGKFSLWRRAIGTTDETQILPDTEGNFYDASFSPDGKYLYYNARLTNQPIAVFRIPVSGGNATKLSLKTPREISVSPDGKRLTFLKDNMPEGKTSVIIADADGTNEREIVTRQAPNYFWAKVKPSWSPDGKMIACVAQNGTESFPHVFEINVEARTERPVTLQKWTSIEGVVWLPDMTGLLVAASEETSSIQQIWCISYPSGEARRVTNDTVNYSGLDLSADGKELVTARLEVPTSIWVIPVEASQSTPAKSGPLSLAASNAKQINVSITGSAYFEGNDARLSWAPDGRIVYMSEESGNADTWSMNSDGSDRKQLTTDPHWDTAAVVSPDGRYIAFQSNRAGSENVWIMDIAGGNQRCLTNKFVERVPDFSADSKWVFFDSWETGKETIWKVPVEGGEPIQVVADLSDLQNISSDGNLLAYMGVSAPSAMNPSSNKLFIAPSAGGPPIKSLDANGYEYYWFPNRRSLTFRLNRDGVTNLWEQPLDGSAPRQLTYFTSEGVLTHAWSRDGKQLAVARSKITSDVVLISDLRLPKLS